MPVIPKSRRIEQDLDSITDPEDYAIAFFAASVKDPDRPKHCGQCLLGCAMQITLGLKEEHRALHSLDNRLLSKRQAFCSSSIYFLTKERTSSSCLSSCADWILATARSRLTPSQCIMFTATTLTTNTVLAVKLVITARIRLCPLLISSSIDLPEFFGAVAFPKSPNAQVISAGRIASMTLSSTRLRS